MFGDLLTQWKEDKKETQAFVVDFERLQPDVEWYKRNIQLLKGKGSK